MPKHERQNKVDNFLSDIQLVSSDQYKIIEMIRRLFHDTNDQLSEDIKYGGLVFNGLDSLIGGIFVYKKHISIEFSNGAEFADPATILEGKGKLRRHIKIVKRSDIESKNIVFYIKQAVS